MSDLRQQLRDSLQGRVCLIGVGSVERGDDAAGVRLVEELLRCEVRSGNSEPLNRDSHPFGGDFGLRTLDFGLSCLIAGTRPERVVDRVAGMRFDHVVFADAVDFGGLPGAAIFLDAEQMSSRFPQISTHRLSLGLLAKWAEANGKTRAWLLGVQPESLSREGLSLPVKRTVELLKDLIGECFSEMPVGYVSHC